MARKDSTSMVFLENFDGVIWSTPLLKNEVQKQIILYEALLATIRDRLDEMRSAVEHQSSPDDRRHIISNRIFNTSEIRREIRETIGRELPSGMDSAIAEYEKATIYSSIDNSIDRLEESLTQLAGRSIRATSLASERTYFGGPDEEIVEQFVDHLGEEYGRITAEAFGWHRETTTYRPIVIVEGSPVDEKMDELDGVVEQVYARRDKLEICYPDEAI